MAGAFSNWDQRLGRVTDESSRMEALREAVQWRIANLSDVVGNRSATWAIATLHQKGGNTDEAKREAQSLQALCQTPPVATRAEWSRTRDLLRSLGLDAPPPARPAREPKRSKKAKAAKEPTTRTARASLDDVVALGLDGKPADALALMRSGKRGGRSELVRVWLELDLALSKSGKDRQKALADLARQLRSRVAGKEVAPTPAPVDKPKAEAPKRGASPLDAWLPEVPRRREDLLDAIAAAIAARPDEVDAIAAAALLHHHQRHGAKRPAPWLVQFVAQAYATGSAEQTRAAIAKLSADGSFAVSAYEEWAFTKGVELLAGAQAAGWGWGILRRGVLSRNAPKHRRLWTLRFPRDAGQRMVVFSAPAEEAFAAEHASMVLERLPRLAGATVTVAPGASNAGLRSALAEAGLVSMDGEPSPAEVLASLAALTLPEPEPEESKGEATVATKVEAATDAEDRPDPLEALRELLTGVDLPSSDALAEPVGQLPRYRNALIAAGDWFREVDGLLHERVAALLDAVHAQAKPTLRLQEGVTLALDALARQAGSLATYLAEGEAAVRYVGDAGELLAGVARAAGGAGWTVTRAMRGVTRRERREVAGIDTFAPHLDGLWRLTFENGERKRQVWVVHSLPAEGRAGLPLLLSGVDNPLVVLPLEGELLAWYASLELVPAIGWDAEASDVLVGALAEDA